MARAAKLFGKIKDTLIRPKIKLELRELSPEEKQKVRDAFDLYDENHDNHIDQKELEHALEHFLGKKPTKTQLDNCFKKVDTNKDGEISYEEFETMMSRRNAQKIAYHKMFDKYDKDGDGLISRAELLEALNKLDFTKIHESSVTEEDVDAIIQLADLGKLQSFVMMNVHQRPKTNTCYLIQIKTDRSTLRSSSTSSSKP